MSDMTPRKLLFSHFALVGKAVGHGHRLELLEHLGQGERCVDALAKCVGLSIANTSQHLQQLRRAGLVASRRSGQQVLYSLTDDSVVELLTVLRRIAENNLADVQKLASEHYTSRDALEPVTREELMVRLRRGQATVLDVRPSEEYAAGHVPGAVNIPVTALERHLGELPKDHAIVAYCRGPYCALAYQAVAALRDRGYDARRLEDGFPEWKTAGLPIE